MTGARPIERFSTDWQGISLSVAFEADWLGMGARGGYHVAHLQIRSIRPEDAALPITDTGYRSHFVHPADIAEAGGPVAYVLAWLDDAATTPQWREHLRQAHERALAERQGSLF